MNNPTKQQVLDNITQLIESGESSVEFEDIKITNRSLNDLLKIERRLRQQAVGKRRSSFSGILPDIYRGIE